MPGKIRVIIVPHTHWDRAWYVPFEEFRLRLVRMVDRLVHTLEHDPEFRCFCLDGQAIVLRDYLEIRPGMEERLRTLVRAGRLFIGPWYTLPDEFLVSGEALVRNLMEGARIGREFGHTMNAGYVPDSFGHIAQLPQILRGFGMDSFVFFRGVDQAASPLKIEFQWRAPDGSTVLASQQRPFYGNGTHLGYITNWGDTEIMVQKMGCAVKQVREACEFLGSHSVARTFLLGNGIDQSEHQPDLPRLLKKLARKFPEYEIKIGSFEDYLAGLRRDTKGKRLQVHQGELLYAYGDLLRGVNSSRMYMKTLNQRCQDLLEKWTEPVAAMAAISGAQEYPREELAHAWRELMKTHPHDDVCGASTDQVHREGEMRLAAADQVGRMLHRTILRRFALQTDRSRQSGVPILLFNTLGVPRSEVVRIDLDLVPQDEPWESVAIVDELGNPVPHEPIGVARAHWWEALKPFDVMRHTLELKVDLPSFGYRTLYARHGSLVRARARVKAASRRFENEYYRMNIADNGTISLADKTTQRRFSGLLLFEEMEDCGDEYNWSYLREHSQTITTQEARPGIQLIHSGPFSATWRITHRMRLPESLSESRKSRSKKTGTIEIDSEVTCHAGSPRIDVVTRLHNTIKDHRLRVLFPTGIETDTVHVDGHFAVIERPIALPPDKETIPAYPTQHQLRFSDLTDGQVGFAIVNQGLPEFDVLRKGKQRILAQTLFRAVGWLGRDDFPTRPFSASPMIPAPEAQCLRPMEFHYAFMAHSGDWRAVMPEALKHNVGVCVTRGDLHGGTDLRQMGIALDEDRAKQEYKPVSRSGPLPDALAMLDLGSNGVVLSAVKQCEWNHHLIVRFYNPGPKPIQGVLRLFVPVKRAWAVGLNEKRTKALPVVKGAVRYRCPVYSIFTMELEVPR